MQANPEGRGLDLDPTYPGTLNYATVIDCTTSLEESREQSGMGWTNRFWNSARTTMRSAYDLDVDRGGDEHVGARKTWVAARSRFSSLRTLNRQRQAYTYETINEFAQSAAVYERPRSDCNQSCTMTRGSIQSLPGGRQSDGPTVVRSYVGRPQLSQHAVSALFSQRARLSGFVYV
jgi:hypothetical protein